MKLIYRCEYCDFTGIEEDVLKHEETCNKNYNLKSCLTCKHCSTDGIKKMECKQGKEIPEGKMFERCPLHEKGTPEITGVMKMFGDMFEIQIEFLFIEKFMENNYIETKFTERIKGVATKIN